jgi:hypothetical protein
MVITSFLPVNFGRRWQNPLPTVLKKARWGKMKLVNESSVETVQSRVADKNLLVLKKEQVMQTGWKPIRVSTEVYRSLKSISNETAMPINKVAVTLLEFALERTVIEKWKARWGKNLSAVTSSREALEKV